MGHEVRSFNSSSRPEIEISALSVRHEYRLDDTAQNSGLRNLDYAMRFASFRALRFSRRGTTWTVAFRPPRRASI